MRPVGWSFTFFIKPIVNLLPAAQNISIKPKIDPKPQRIPKCARRQGTRPTKMEILDLTTYSDLFFFLHSKKFHANPCLLLKTQFHSTAYSDCIFEQGVLLSANAFITFKTKRKQIKTKKSKEGVSK